MTRGVDVNKRTATTRKGCLNYLADFFSHKHNVLGFEPEELMLIREP